MKPLGTVDSSFLLIENRTMPMHTGGLLLFSYPEGAHEEWLHEAFTANDDPDTVQYPFNQKLAWPLRRLGLPHWVTDHDLDTHYHVRHSALPKPGRYREMFSLVSRLHSTRLHRDRPLWEAHVIEGVEDNRFALYVKTHHSMIDGVGAMRMLRACLSADPNERDMPAPWNTPRARPESNGSATSGNVIAAATGALGGVLKFASAVRDRGEHGMMAPFQTPLTMLNRRVTGSRRFVAAQRHGQRYRPRHVGRRAATVPHRPGGPTRSAAHGDDPGLVPRGRRRGRGQLLLGDVCHARHRDRRPTRPPARHPKLDGRGQARIQEHE
ncbi:MAG: hypothetical protein JRD94_11915 [Deltaproteobacteria bacterium]|nr:hypothetical protein [Deltaproteobacteria bacterium]